MWALFLCGLGVCLGWRCAFKGAQKLTHSLRSSGGKQLPCAYSLRSSDFLGSLRLPSALRAPVAGRVLERTVRAQNTTIIEGLGPRAKNKNQRRFWPGSEKGHFEQNQVVFRDCFFRDWGFSRRGCSGPTGVFRDVGFSIIRHHHHHTTSPP